MLEAPLVAFLGAFGVNLVATPYVIRMLKQRAVLDIPNERSSHLTPVPRGGGILIVTTWLAGMVATWIVGFRYPELEIARPAGFAIAATIGMGVLAVMGWLDDRQDLNPVGKLVVQMLVAGQALWISGLRLADFGLPFLPAWDLGWWGWPLALIWLVGFTNIFNFMDGINGLAFTQLICGGATFAVLGIMIDDYQLAVSGSLAAGAAAGILKYNFPRAMVFMGDVGSLPTGFLLALMALQAAFGSHDRSTPFIVPALILWPFLYDGTYTLLNRLVHGRNPLRAHRSHLYQRLAVAGRSHQSITLRYGLAMIGCSVCGLLFLTMTRGRQSLLLGLVLIVSILFTVRTVRRVRAYQTGPEGNGHLAGTTLPDDGDPTGGVDLRGDAGRTGGPAAGQSPPASRIFRSRR